MEHVTSIVSRLTDPLFDRNLSLVTFDNLQGNDLMQVLIDVFSSVDPNLKSIDKYARDKRQKERIIHLLTLLKFPDIPQNKHLYNEGIESFHYVHKPTIYSILNWVLSTHSKLVKRAYLANYLVPIEPPPAYLMQDEVLKHLTKEYRQAQEEFKTIHKIYEVEQSKNPKGWQKKDSR
mmetsp:Transcript_13934/g.30614  ORF Transcript_13934/g.30614 Transcript_13934/m.30614 type:complete len:177 (-) Transcript_13934:817-1347(-)